MHMGLPLLYVFCNVATNDEAFHSSGWVTSYSGSSPLVAELELQMPPPSPLPIHTRYTTREHKFVSCKHEIL